MARLFGFIGNRPELGTKVLERYATELSVTPEPPEAIGWGLGFYQFGEVLLRRRHLETLTTVDPGTMAAEVSAEVLIGHVRRPTVGNLRTENTHPFRYKEWLFAQIGTPAAFADVRPRLLETLPPFLRSNVRGDTDSEVLFHLILSCLHEVNHIDTLHTRVAIAGTALRKALSQVNDVCAQHDLPSYSGDMLLTNGEHILAVHQSGHMAYRLVNTAEDVESFLKMDSERVPNPALAHCTVVASEVTELPPNWVRVASGSLVTLGPTSAPQVESITP
jgi:predicted glutamine amidotransferase